MKEESLSFDMDTLGQWNVEPSFDHLTHNEFGSLVALPSSLNPLDFELSPDFHTLNQNYTTGFVEAPVPQTQVFGPSFNGILSGNIAGTQSMLPSHVANENAEPSVSNRYCSNESRLFTWYGPLTSPGISDFPALDTVEMFPNSLLFPYNVPGPRGPYSMG
jgi:hypothetical protein